VMKRDMKMRTPVRSGSPRADWSTMFNCKEGLPMAARLSHLCYGSVLTEVVSSNRAKHPRWAVHGCSNTPSTSINRADERKLRPV
jgi:hypothetical protein